MININRNIIININRHMFIISIIININRNIRIRTIKINISRNIRIIIIIIIFLNKILKNNKK